MLGRLKNLALSVATPTFIYIELPDRFVPSIGKPGQLHKHSPSKFPLDFLKMTQLSSP